MYWDLMKFAFNSSSWITYPKVFEVEENSDYKYACVCVFFSLYFVPKWGTMVNYKIRVYYFFK